MGADDYVVKPFSPRELAALRVRSVLRRAQGSLENENDRRSAEYCVTTHWSSTSARTRPSLAGNQRLALTAREFDLLWSTCSGIRARPSPRASCWNTRSGAGRSATPSTVTVHVRRLREKDEPDPTNPDQDPDGLGCRIPVGGHGTPTAGSRCEHVVMTVVRAGVVVAGLAVGMRASPR